MKFVAIILSALFVGSILAGCGPRDTSEAGSPTAAAENGVAPTPLEGQPQGRAEGASRAADFD